MELEQMEQRQVTLTLPAEIWAIFDGANELAVAANGQQFEMWVSQIVLQAALRCLRTVMQVDEQFFQSPTAGNV